MLCAMRLSPAFAGALLSTLAGCNLIFGLEAPAGGDDGLDAAGDVDGPPSDGRTGWSAPRTIPAAAVAAVTEDDGAIAPGGKELYFSAVIVGGTDEDIMVSTDDGGVWQTAVRSPLSSPGTVDTGIRFTVPQTDPTGAAAYFASNRLGASLEIYFTSRPMGGAWSTPTPVPSLNSLTDDYTASPCLGGTRFVVASSRGGASSDLYDIVPNLTTTPIAAANTAGTESGPFVTEDCLRLYFASDIDGTLDLYVTTRETIDAPWSERTKIEDLSTSVNEGDPWLGDDERHMIFALHDGNDLNLVESFR